MPPIAAVLAVPIALWLIVAGWPVIDAPPPIEPIPLKAAAVATPVRFPTVPPIRVTPMFVSTAETPVPFSPWHRQTLMQHYLPEPDMYPGAH